MPQSGGREGGALQYGGRTTYLCQGDPVGEHPIFLKFLIRHASYFDKVLQYIQKVIQWHFPGEKVAKPLGLAKANRMVSKPTQDWKTVGGQKIFLLFGKRRPSTEVKQWMLRSMCDDCPHKIFTHHVTIRSHNITQYNDPNNRADQMSIPFETNPP